MMEYHLESNYLDQGFETGFDDSMNFMMNQPGSENMPAMMHQAMHNQTGVVNDRWQTRPFSGSYAPSLFHLLAGVNLILLAGLLVALIRYYWVKGGK